MERWAIPGSRGGRNPGRRMDLGWLCPRSGTRVFQPAKAGVVDKSLCAFYFCSDTTRSRSIWASCWQDPCLSYAPDGLAVEAGSGSGNESRDQLSLGYPVCLQPSWCGPSPSRQDWTRGWGGRRRMEGCVREVAEQRDTVPFDGLRSLITSHLKGSPQKKSVNHGKDVPGCTFRFFLVCSDPAFGGLRVSKSSRLLQTTKTRGCGPGSFRRWAEVKFLPLPLVRSGGSPRPPRVARTVFGPSGSLLDEFDLACIQRYTWPPFLSWPTPHLLGPGSTRSDHQRPYHPPPADVVARDPRSPSSISILRTHSPSRPPLARGRRQRKGCCRSLAAAFRLQCQPKQTARHLIRSLLLVISSTYFEGLKKKSFFYSRSLYTIIKRPPTPRRAPRVLGAWPRARDSF